MIRHLALALLTCDAHALRIPGPFRAMRAVDPRFVAEAEFKHARVAMLALPALAGLSAAGVDEPVRWLSQQPMDTQLTFFATAGALESVSLARLDTKFRLFPDLVPGDFLGVGPSNATALELGVGRVAMLTAAATLVAGA